MTSEKKSIAVYGSLRKGEYNYNRSDLDYIETIQLAGFNLHWLPYQSYYPGIKEGDGKIVVDIMECSQPTFEQIVKMEERANYTAKEIKIGNRDCTIFIYNGAVADLIPHGNWLNR